MLNEEIRIAVSFSFYKVILSLATLIAILRDCMTLHFHSHFSYASLITNRNAITNVVYPPF